MEAGERDLRRHAAAAVMILTATAVLAALSPAGAPADARTTIFTGGPTLGGPQAAKTTRIPPCAEDGLERLRPPRIPRGERDPDEIREIMDRFRRQAKRYVRCERRFYGGISRLGASFVVALQRGNELRACKLLTGRERARLGGDSCKRILGAVEGRLAEDREPRFGAFEVQQRYLRGEITIRLVRPFEKVGLRFVDERGYWRLANVRDLLRQHPVEDPIAVPSG